MLRKSFLSMVLLVGLLITQSVPRAQAARCDHLQFVSDITIPDGSSVGPGATFTKTWRLMNIGTCTWTTSYSLIWEGGELMGGPHSVKLPVDVPPGQMVDLSVNLTAPTFPANYMAFFKLSNASGTPFGMGQDANLAFYVNIHVVQINAVIYDFVANAPYAQWKSGAGALPFPGTSGDSRGYALAVSQPHLEDDSLDSAPGLLTVPQNKFNGYIQATYPEFQVQQGDRLQTLVNCEFGATGCYVTFRIDYLLPNGAQKTLWSWKEAADRRFYRADVSLNALAGQRVRFVFMLLSSGFASGDRALWGSPRIVRSGSTLPPGPPATLTPLPPLPATPTPLGQPAPTFQPSGCDRAAFVTDVTITDGTVFSPGAAFTKTWRLKNTGTCAWSTSYKLLYYSGEQMGAPTAVNLPWHVPPGQTVDISVNMVAPAAAGEYRGFWILSNANGQFFGIGTDAAQPVWVEINVAGDAPVGAGYDFVSNVCSAEWKSGAGRLPCPGADGSASGFILRQDAPKMEDGTTGAPGLLTVPQNRYNGYIQGFYPTFTVQPGDKFQATIGCAHGAACSLTYRLDYMTATGYIGTFWQWREQNEGKVYSASVDLSPLAGRSVRFILTILATGSAANDRALWGSPRIVRTGPAPIPTTATPTPTPTATSTPPGPDWLNYANALYGFQFKYPSQAQIVDQSPNSLRMNLPFVQGTNLREKYLQVTVRENINPCQSPLAESGIPGAPENVLINGIPFLKQAASDGGVGHLREWVGYSTLRGNACISLEFVLHSLHAGNFETPPPVFDKAAESLVFTQMMATFGWLPPSNDWQTYTNAQYGFLFKYPPQAQIVDQSFNSLRMNLPFVPGTNLREKYLEMSVRENVTPCRSPLATRSILISSETVTINGISFLKETGGDGAAGNFYDWVAYSTPRNNTCISMDFVLHSLNAGNFPTPPPVFDKAVESPLFTQMMATFAWTTALPPLDTPTPTATATSTPDAFLPDLTIVQMKIELENPTSCVAPSDALGARLWVKNQGQDTAGSFVVTVNGIGQTINGLGIGETVEVFFANTSNPVMAAVDTGNAVTEGDENNNTRSEMVPVPTPPAQCTFSGPYAVTGVAPGDVLNVRSWYGVSYPIIGSFPHNAVDIMRTGPSADVGGELWVEVQLSGGRRGWVNAQYLEQYVSHEAFCADARIPALLEQLKSSVNQSNGDILAAIVSPAHGLDVRLWAYEPPVNFSPAQARNLFTSSDVYAWGAGPAGGTDYGTGTFSQIIQPRLQEVFSHPSMETYCDNLTKVFPLSNPWPYSNIRYYNLYKPGSEQFFDWRTWLIGFEYVDGQPYLHSMVSIVWEP